MILQSRRDGSLVAQDAVLGTGRAFTVFPFFILTSSFLIVLGLVSSFCALEHNIPHPKRCTFFCFDFMELSVLASTLAFGG